MDGRLSNQIRSFELTKGRAVIDTCNGSCRLYLPQENLTVLVGIKADVVSLADRSPDSKLATVCLTSTITKNQTLLEKEYLDKVIGEVSLVIQGLLDKCVAADRLTLIEKKLAWQVYLDVFVNGYISYCNIDHLSYAVRAALESCELPQLEVNLNNISNEYSFSVKPGETCRPFSDVAAPHCVVGGYVKGQVFFDLTLLESLAADCVFLGYVSADGDILELRKVDGGDIKAEAILTIANELRKYAKALYSYQLFDISD